MQQDLNRVIEQVSKEKGIDKTILISALENAMVSAAKKKFGHHAQDRGAVQSGDRRGRAVRSQDRGGKGSRRRPPR